MDRIRILLADDHLLLLELLKTVLAEEFEVVGVVPDGRALLSECQRLRPQLVLLDIGMPLLNGIEAAHQISKQSPEIKIVFVTQHTDRQYVEAAFRAGASGYVLKHAALSELSFAVKEVMAGRPFVSSSLAQTIPASLRGSKQAPGDVFNDTLTRRQREVLQLVAEGKAGKDIAHILQISPKTVAFHKAGIMDELGLRTTAELTRYAIDHGLLVR